MSNPIPCTFVSVWDGGVEVESSAVFHPDTNQITDIETASLPEGVLNSLDQLEREYVRIGDQDFDIDMLDDGSYIIVCD